MYNNSIYPLYEARDAHEKMWRWIADNIEYQLKSYREGPKRLSLYTMRALYFKSHRPPIDLGPDTIPMNHMEDMNPCCTYTHFETRTDSRISCDLCPFRWTKEESRYSKPCMDPNSPYAVLEKLAEKHVFIDEPDPNAVEEFKKLAVIIAKLPWKDPHAGYDWSWEKTRDYAFEHYWNTSCDRFRSMFPGTFSR